MTEKLFTLLIILSVVGCNSQSKKQQSELSERVAQVISNSEQLIEKLEFDKALSELIKVDEDIPSSALKDTITKAVWKVSAAKQNYKEKLSQGWSHFENKFISAAEKENILKQRDQEEKRRLQLIAEKKQKREIEKKRREAEKIAAEIAEKKEREVAEKERELAEKKERQHIIDYTNDSRALVKYYTDNEIQADIDFKDKLLYVKGKIDSIGKDIIGSMYVSLEGQSFRTVQCMFDKKYELQLASLKSGEEILIKGVCKGLMMNIIMRDCEIITLP